MKTNILISISVLIFSFGNAQDPISYNPNNSSANVQLNWKDNIPRIRYGGDGPGSANGFQIQGQGDDVKFTVLNNGSVGIGTTSPGAKLHVAHTSRMSITLGGPSTSSGAVGDVCFKTKDNQTVGGTTYWNWSFRTDSWSSAPGDLVLYSSNGTYTSPIIAQADGDLLFVTGNGSSRNGNVGIGTTNPLSKLSINQDAGTAMYPTSTSRGDALETLTSGNNVLEIGNSKENNARRAWILARHSNLGSYGHYYSTLHLQPDIGNKSQYKGVSIGYSADTQLSVGTHLAINGNVGIGITDPSEKLVVDGNILAEEIKVQNVPASDYVFEPDYDLMPLNEVDQFIRENKHLPDIPSAEEFKENGVGLGEMDNMLLRKVEELTLYVIELKKENEEMKKATRELMMENQIIKTDLLKELEIIKAQLK